MKNENPTLSIIIPVYNVERYVGGTLESIYSQKFDESLFEVIVVNDGTPDASMDIVARYAGLHKNLTVINQKNQGLSVARNNGLEVAQGEYVWFVDCDDKIMPGSIQQCIKKIVRHYVDIHAFDFFEVDEESGKGCETRMLFFPKDEHFYEKPVKAVQLVGRCHTGAVQHLLVRRQFLLDNKCLRFKPGIYFEDMEFMCRAFVMADRMMFHRFCAYRYLRRRSGSIMSSFKPKYFEDRMEIIKSLLAFTNQYTSKGTDRTYMMYYIKQHAINFYEYVKSSRQNMGIEIYEKNKTLLRKLVWKGLVADLRFGDVKKFVKGVLYLIHPNLELYVKSAKARL